MMSQAVTQGSRTVKDLQDSKNDPVKVCFFSPQDRSAIINASEVGECTNDSA